MKPLRWLTVQAVQAIHHELIARYGGVFGVRDQSSLESALARPRNFAAYRRGFSLGDLAAAYGWALLRNHPFVDGNKRIALAAMIVFLEINGWELTCSEAEETATVLRAAAGEISEPAWSAWMRRNAQPSTRKLE